MLPGAPRVTRAPQPTAIPAPPTGVLLGADGSATVSLRLFRSEGLRIVAAGLGVAAPLLALRAVSLGVAARVRTVRPQMWRTALLCAEDAVIAPPGPEPAAAGTVATPVLVVDDRPGENAPPGEVSGWQCRLDVRAPLSAADVMQYAAADLLLTPSVPAEVAEMLTTIFELPASAVRILNSMPAAAVAVVRAGRLRVVVVAPQPSELPSVLAERPVGPLAPPPPARRSAFPGAPTPLPPRASGGPGPSPIAQRPSVRPPRPSLPPPPARADPSRINGTGAAERPAGQLPSLVNAPSPAVARPPVVPPPPPAGPRRVPPVLPPAPPKRPQLGPVRAPAPRVQQQHGDRDTVVVPRPNQHVLPPPPKQSLPRHSAGQLPPDGQ